MGAEPTNGTDLLSFFVGTNHARFGAEKGNPPVLNDVHRPAGFSFGWF